MNLIDSFLLATAFIYLVAALYAFMGRPALDDVPASRQGIIYVCLFSLIVLSLKVPSINLIMGFIYCFSSGSSFIGWPQKWMSYWKAEPHDGSGAQQVGMAAWDLLLAVAFFMRTP